VSIPPNPPALPYDLRGKRVFVSGHRGMLGSALVRRLAREACEILTAGREELDLLRQNAVEDWLRKARPDVVLVAAARVGGIHANSTRPAEFLYENLAIQNHLIHGAYLAGVEKLLFAASSCIYPRAAPQPMKEEYLLTGPLEPTNEGYALAKIAGLKMCEAYRRQYGCDFIAAIPPNLYGPNDNFDPLASHVIAGMLRRAHQARLEGAPSFEIWGTGVARREFLHVDDAADACIFLLTRYSGELAPNVGSGEDVSIRELAAMVCEVVGYTGPITFDAGKPDGMPVKRLDVGRVQAMGWKASIPLAAGLASTYEWFLSQQNIRGV